METKRWQRILSLLLSAVLAFQLLPAQVFASEVESTAGSDVLDWEIPVKAEPDVIGEVQTLRERSGKQFRLSDGSFAAVSYGIPVHYQDENGSWLDVDNTLTLSQDAVQYVSVNGDEQRSFAETLITGQQLLAAQYKDCSVTLSLLPREEVAVYAFQNEQEGVQAVVINPGELSAYSGQARSELPFSEQVLPEKMGSYVFYEGVFPGIDLMYENYGYSIKETILVNSLQDGYSYDFLLETDGLTPVLNPSGSVLLSDESGTVIYEIPAPYMFDAEGAKSCDVAYTLEPSGEDYVLTVTADDEWIEAAERTLPVSIDPTISLKCQYIGDGTMYTTHVVQGDPNLAHNGVAEQYVGYGSGYNSDKTVPIRECQIYLHVASLPSIPQGCEMVNASLNLYNYGINGFSSVGTCSTLEIAAYPVTEDASNGNYKSWIEGMTWNTKPAFDSENLIDFAVASQITMGQYVQWDMTEQVDEWYANPANTNRTIALAGYESSAYSLDYCAVAVFKGYAENNINPPTLIVNYRSAIGLEDYYSAQAHSIGSAGTAYVGDYSGQLTLVKNLASNASTVMPFSLNLVYNSTYGSGSFPETGNTGMDFGNGWKLDVIQSLEACTGDLSDYMLYRDGDGTYHYFLKNGSQWDDEDGLDLTITKNGTIKSSSGSDLKTGVYVIKNSQDDQLLFWNGLPVQQRDANGNTIFYLYNGAAAASGAGWLPDGSDDQLTKIIQHNKEATEDATLAELVWDSAGRLTKVTDRAGNTQTLSYDENGYLKEVKGGNGHTGQYTYDGAYLDEAIDVNGNYKIKYAFAEDPHNPSRKRIGGFTEYGSEAGSIWIPGASIQVSGSRDKTTYRSQGLDGVLSNNDDILTTYLFDDEGRTINVYTTDVNETVVYGASTGAYSATSGASNTNNHLLNAASFESVAVNLLTNGSFEAEGGTSGLALGWSYSVAASEAAVTQSNSEHRTGNHSVSFTSGTYNAAQTVSGLQYNKPYTFSAYVNTTGATSFGTDGGVYLGITNGGSGTSDKVNYVTSAAMDNGWTRISVTFVAQSTSATMNIKVKNITGTVYVDDCQLEQDDAPGNINLVANSSMGDASGWTLNSNTSYAGTSGIGGSRALGIASTPITLGYAEQSIPINLPYTETYVLSGWAKANALPSNQLRYPKMKLFALKAEICYEGEECDEFFLPFSAEIDNEWQFASMVLVPRKEKTVTHINVYCLYFQNSGTAYFDNISLIREPAQTMKYDENGYLVSVATPGVEEDTNTYSEGNLTKVVTSGSGTFTYTYDSYHNVKTATNGLVTQTNEYNTGGNLKSATLTGKNTEETITTSATYTNDRNRLYKVTDAMGSVTTYSYVDVTEDALLHKMYGQPSSVTDAKNQKVFYVLNNDGSINSQYVKDLISLSYSYSNHRLDSVTRTAGNASQVYSLHYNVFGQTDRIQVGNQTLVTNDYNDAGYLEEQTYGNGATVNFAYDELGRVKTSTTSSGRTVSYAYSADGNLGSVKLNSGLSYDYLYDGLGRLITSARHDNGSLVLQTRHEYDASNRLSKQYIKMAGKSYSEGYTYDEYGRITAVTADNSTGISYTYDELSRLKTVTTPVYKITYTYIDGTTLVAGMEYTSVGNGFPDQSFSLTYDELGNITERNYGANFGAKSYTYDSLGQLIKQQNSSGAYEYAYDGFGNLQEVTNKTGTHTYDYGDSNWGDLLTTFDGQAIEYDAIGNSTRYYNGTRWTLYWENGREMSSAEKTTDKAKTTVTYSYDGDGIRLSKTVVTETYAEGSGSGHSYKAQVITPTCTEGGYTVYTCACGDSYTDYETEATGHNFVSGVCTVCGAAGAHTHSYTSVVTEPTCTTGGYTTHTCSCGDSYVDSETAPMGHDFSSFGEDGLRYCVRCDAQDPSTEEPKLFEIAYASMTMGNSLAINFAFRQDCMDDWTGCYAKIEKLYADGRENVVEIVPQTDWKTTRIFFQSYYFVTFNGIAAKEMTDNVYVTIYNADGEAISVTREDSVQKQAIRALRNYSANWEKTMIVDMLNYGTEAQIYFGYGLDNLANSGLTEAQKAMASTPNTCTNTRTSSGNFVASTVVLKSNIQMMFAFSGVDETCSAVATFTNHRGEEKTIKITGSDFGTNGYHKTVTIDALAVADARQDVTCVVYDASGNEVARVTDSVESYTARASGNNAVLFQALMQFADSAYAFFHNGASPATYSADGTQSDTGSDSTEWISFDAVENGSSYALRNSGDEICPATREVVDTTTKVYEYVYAGGKLLRQTIDDTSTSGTDVVMYFYYDPNGNPYAMEYNGYKLYYVLNPQGDVQFMVDESGNSVATYAYDAWGNLLFISENNVYAENNPLRYRGYVYDTETGFYYLQSRYYDPAIGRFINADSFASTGQGFMGYNMFAYCNNDPVNNADDTGCSPFGVLTIADYYAIHKEIQITCLALHGYDMEVYVKNASGKRGYLDLYDLKNNAYYEVKSEGAAKKPSTSIQMARYDSSIIAAKRYKDANITQPPSRGTKNISGTVPYGLYDVEYELRSPGLIVYDPHINWSRTIACAVLVAAVAAAPVTSGQSIFASIPALGELAPAFSW